jgi:hypothetical protein
MMMSNRPSTGSSSSPNHQLRAAAPSLQPSGRPGTSSGVVTSLAAPPSQLASTTTAAMSSSRGSNHVYLQNHQHLTTATGWTGNMAFQHPSSSYAPQDDASEALQQHSIDHEQEADSLEAVQVPFYHSVRTNILMKKKIFFLQLIYFIFIFIYFEFDMMVCS